MKYMATVEIEINPDLKSLRKGLDLSEGFPVTDAIVKDLANDFIRSELSFAGEAFDGFEIKEVSAC